MLALATEFFGMSITSPQQMTASSGFKSLSDDDVLGAAVNAVGSLIDLSPRFNIQILPQNGPWTGLPPAFPALAAA